MKISKILNIVKLVLFVIAFILIMSGNSSTMSISFTLITIVMVWSVIEYLIRISMMVEKKVKKLEDEENKI